MAGAILDVATGKVSWLDHTKVDEILAQAEASPERATNPFADG